MDDSAIIRIIRAAIPDAIAIYRFGSTVEGGMHERSDIDVAVLAARALNPVDRFELQERLAVTLRRDVDLIDLRAASTVVRMQVIVHGMPLAVFEAHEQRLFETYTYSDYARLNEERGGILDQVQREPTVYGR